MRYNELKKSLPGIKPKILSLRLKEMQTANLIVKKVDDTKSVYTLTSSSKDFIFIIKDIKKWALKWNLRRKICIDTTCEDCDL